jgi:hypothetical protein
VKELPATGRTTFSFPESNFVPSVHDVMTPSVAATELVWTHMAG